MKESSSYICNEDFPDKTLSISCTPRMGKSRKNLSSQSLFGLCDSATTAFSCSLPTKLGETQFLSLSFVLDTGAPCVHLLLSPGAAMDIARASWRMGMERRHLHGDRRQESCCCQGNPPHSHRPANIIGLPLLERFGLVLQPDRTFSSAHRQVNYL